MRIGFSHQGVDDSVKQGHGARVRVFSSSGCFAVAISVALAWWLPLTLLPAQTLQAGAGVRGTVVRVHDGDTVTILTPDKTEVKIRLLGIDAPEAGQPYGSAAKKSLSSLVFGREAHLHATGTDKYGRTLGQLHVGDLWVNHEQILRGMAWHYVQYSQDAQLALAEADARKARRGIWQDAKSVPPWLWRRQPHKKNG